MSDSDADADADADSPTSVEEPIYIVERVLSQSIQDGKDVFLVRWKDYGLEECTWEPAESFLGGNILSDWYDMRDSGDFYSERDVAKIQAAMDRFQKKKAQKKAQKEAVEEAGEEAEKRRREEVKRAFNLRPGSRSARAPSTAKRPRASSTQSVKEEAPEDSSVEETETAERPLRPNHRTPKKGIARVISKKDKANPPPATAANPNLDDTTPAPRPLAQSEGAPGPISSPKQARENTQTDQDPTPKTPNVTSSLGLQQSMPTESNTSATGQQPGNAHAAPMATYTGKGKTGQRFENMRDQNRFSRFSNREPVPDISRLDLGEADAWPVSGSIEPASKIQETTPRYDRDDSPLFVPEDSETELPQTGNQRTGQERSKSPSLSVLGDSPLPAIEASPTIPTMSAAPKNPAANQGSPQGPPGNTLTEASPTAIRVDSRGVMPPTAPKSPFAQRRPSSPSRPCSNYANDSSSPRRDEAIVRSTPVYAPFSYSAPQNPMTSRSDRVNRKASNRRSRDDLDIHLRFEDRSVGFVTLADVPWWLDDKLRAAARAAGDMVPTIEFKKTGVMSEGEFSRFAAKLHMQKYGPFSIWAQGAPRQAVKDIYIRMKDNDCVAVWEYPQIGDSLILVLFSNRAQPWQDSRDETVGGSETPLKIFVRNKLSASQLMNDPRVTDYVPPSTGGRTPRWPEAVPESPQPARRSSVAEDAVVYTQSPDETSAPTPTITLAKRPTRLVGSQVQSPVESPTSASRALTLLADQGANSCVFSANFEELFDDVDRLQREPCVMICFGKSNPVEAQAVRQWLHTQMSPGQVFVDTEKDGWDEFRDGVSSKAGAVLFHAQHRAYCDLPLFYTVLGQQHLSCFEVSFSSPLRQPKDPKLAPESPWTRLFPRGSVFCITEDTLVRYPRDASWFMRWFEYRSVKETSWRLALLPDVSSWVLQRAKESRDQVAEEYVNIVRTVNRLKFRSSEASWSNMSRGDDPDEFVHARPWDHSSEIIQSPSPLPFFGDWSSANFDDAAVKARDKSLVEWFVGWAAANSRVYRTFYVLDSTHNNETEKHSWHIQFQTITSWVEETDRTEGSRSEAPHGFRAW